MWKAIIFVLPLITRAVPFVVTAGFVVVPIVGVNILLAMSPPPPVLTKSCRAKHGQRCLCRIHHSFW